MLLPSIHSYQADAWLSREQSVPVSLPLLYPPSCVLIYPEGGGGGTARDTPMDLIDSSWGTSVQQAADDRYQGHIDLYIHLMCCLQGGGYFRLTLCHTA